MLALVKAVMKGHGLEYVYKSIRFDLLIILLLSPSVYIRVDLCSINRVIGS
jgi:hypothetical protein